MPKIPRVLYYGVFIDDATAASLDRFLASNGISVPEGWRRYADHMTIVFGETDDPAVNAYINANFDKDVTLNVIGYGIFEKAIAVKVSGGVSTNANPHITMYVSPDGKPKDSNDIVNWAEVPPDDCIPICGTVRAYNVFSK